MDARVGFAEFDALAVPFDVRVGWAEFDALGAPFRVCVGWAEFDNRSKAVPVPSWKHQGQPYYNPGQLPRYRSEKDDNYTVPVELSPDADEAEEEEVIMALLIEVAQYEI